MSTRLDEILGKAQTARLIPIVADSQAEARMTSVLLATMAVVPSYAREVLRSIDVPFPKTAQLKGYTEVRFPGIGSGGESRCDGLIEVVTRRKRWMAIVESKAHRERIVGDQIGRYVEIARHYGIDCVLTLSNQLVADPTHIPYALPRRKTNLLHISWASLLTNAQLILMSENAMEVEQRFILQEMVRYLDHPKSGVRRFTEMNNEWRTLVNGIRHENLYHRSAPEIEETVASWHQEERDVCLMLSKFIGCRVGLKLPLKHRRDPSERVKATAALLANEHRLHSTFRVPNVADDIALTVDLRSRTISASIRITAPGDRKTARARISWLMRQLRKGRTSEHSKVIVIRASYQGQRNPKQATLAEAELDAHCLEPDQRGKLPTSFEIAMIYEMGGKFAGKRTFIEGLESLIPDFYRKICQHLRAWTPPPLPVEDLSPEPMGRKSASRFDQRPGLHPSEPSAGTSEHGPAAPDQRPDPHPSELPAGPSGHGSATSDQRPDPHPSELPAGPSGHGSATSDQRPAPHPSAPAGPSGHGSATSDQCPAPHPSEPPAGPPRTEPTDSSR